MRRLITMFILLMVFCTTAGLAEAPQLNPTGAWSTSTEETLCGTQLILNPDNTFWLNSEGLLMTGKWCLDGYTLTLYDAASLQTGITGIPQPVSYTLDESCTVLDIGNDLHLYRTVMAMPTYWISSSDESYTGLYLWASGQFYSEKHSLPLDFTTLDGGECMTGTWSQKGLILTLVDDDGSVHAASVMINPLTDGAGSMTLCWDGNVFYPPDIE